MNFSHSLILKTLMATTALTLAGACSEDEEAPGTPVSPETAPKTTEPSAETRAIWSQAANYRSWPKFTENATPKRSPTHENMFVVTYHNQIVAQAITGKTVPLPEGAMIVKENLAKETDTAPMALTVMAKQGSQWYWIKAMPDGKVFLDDMNKPMEGKGVAMCTMCHKLDQNDGVFTHDFSK